jgi:hypothetical protein
MVVLVRAAVEQASWEAVEAAAEDWAARAPAASARPATFHPPARS